MSDSRLEFAPVSVPVRAVYVCVAIIIWVASFGNVQPVFLPGIVESGLFLAACLGLAFIVLYARHLYVTVVGLFFLFGLTAELMVQSFSTDDFRSVAVKTLATGLLFALLSATPALTPASLVRILRYGASLHVVVSAAVIAFSSAGIRPDVGTGRLSWVGWFDQKNYLGLAAAIACATLTAQVLAERRIRLTTAALWCVSITLLIMSHSRGALLWLLAFAACYAGGALGLRLRMIVRILLIACIAIMAAILFAPDDLLRMLGDFTTGRTVLWEQARAYFEQSPWVGHGMGASYRTGTEFFDAYGNVFRGVHNGFLAVLIDTGVVGLSIYLAMISMTASAVAQHPSPEARTLMCMIGAFLIYNCVESALDKTTNISFILFPLALAASMSGAIRLKTVGLGDSPSGIPRST